MNPQYLGRGTVGIFMGWNRRMKTYLTKKKKIWKVQVNVCGVLFVGKCPPSCRNSHEMSKKPTTKNSVLYLQRALTLLDSSCTVFFATLSCSQDQMINVMNKRKVKVKSRNLNYTNLLTRSNYKCYQQKKS